MPKNLNKSQYKKYEFKDEVNHVVLPAESKLGRSQWMRKPSLVMQTSMMSDSLSSSKKKKSNKDSKKKSSRANSQPAKIPEEEEKPHWQIFSMRDKDKSTLPGEAMLYEIKPPKVDYYDVFYFETRVRDMIEEYMEPFKKSHKTDKETSIQLRFDYDRIIEKLYELEHFALI